jgi:hypothetical protein
MPIKRRPTNAYVDDTPDNTTGICHICYEKGLEVVLVPYIMPDGRRDDSYGRCPYCSAIIPKQITKHKTIEGVLGSVEGISEPKYEAVTRRRRVRQDKPIEDLRQDIPPLAGKKDRDIEYMIEEGAIVVNIEDTVVEE